MGGCDGSGGVRVCRLVKAPYSVSYAAYHPRPIRSEALRGLWAACLRHLTRFRHGSDGIARYSLIPQSPSKRYLPLPAKTELVRHARADPRYAPLVRNHDRCTRSVVH